MPARILNPIAEKVRAIAMSGKLGRRGYEAICVAIGISYPTLMNLFGRPNVSYVTRKALRFANLIDEKDEAMYDNWIQANKRRRKKENKDE